MQGGELVVGITALAIAIAGQIEDVDDLGLVGSAFTQLGDTLTTLALVRAREAAKVAAGEEGEAGEDEGAEEAV